MFGSSSGMYTIDINNIQISNFQVLDLGCGFHIDSDMQRLKESEIVDRGKLNLIMGNRRSLFVTRIRFYELVFDSGVVVHLVNYCYSS